jgi:hypothetical protein
MKVKDENENDDQNECPSNAKTEKERRPLYKTKPRSRNREVQGRIKLTGTLEIL